VDNDIERAIEPGTDDEVERQIEAEDDRRVIAGEESIEREEIEENATQA
jgi:hypothetical protein